MAKHDEFDDESFFDSLLNRKGNTELPDGLRRIFIVIGVLVLVSIVIAVAVASWPERQQVDEASVPIIRADSNPYKIKPQDPGGMKVPNKDSTIFETLKGDVPESKTENLLEDESANVEPVERPEPVETAEAKMGAVPNVKSADVENVKPEATPPQPVAPKAEAVTAKKVVEEEEEVVDEKDLPSVIETLKADNKPKEEKAAVKAEPKPASVKPVPTGGSTYIQLAAVKSEAEAQSQWSKFKAKNPELGSLSMRTQKADLGDKGIFYRIQAGPLTADNATKTCTAVKSRGGSCIIAK